MGIKIKIKKYNEICGILNEKTKLVDVDKPFLQRKVLTPASNAWVFS